MGVLKSPYHKPQGQSNPQVLPGQPHITSPFLFIPCGLLKVMDHSPPRPQPPFSSRVPMGLPDRCAGDYAQRAGTHRPLSCPCGHGSHRVNVSTQNGRGAESQVHRETTSLFIIWDCLEEVLPSRAGQQKNLSPWELGTHH